MKANVLIIVLMVIGGIVGWVLAPDYERRGHGDEWAHTAEVDQWASEYR